MGLSNPMLAERGAILSVHAAFGFDCVACDVERMKSEGLVPPAKATFTSPVLSLTSIVAVNSLPVAPGLKVTETWHLSFWFRLAGQLLVSANAAGLVPEKVAPMKLSGCSPVLLTLTIIAALVFPFPVAGNWRFVGVTTGLAAEIVFAVICPVTA